MGGQNLSKSVFAFLFILNVSFLFQILPVPFLILMFLIPETPRYLVTRGKIQTARSALQWFRGPCADINMELHVRV